jgi:hypothetical protein
MSSEKPDYHDADLMLRVYEMRREAVTREHRDKLNFEFWPKSYDDVKAVQKNDHPLNQAWRQLSGYWELVYGMARNGIVHPDYLAETNGEGLFFFAKVAPYLAEIRRDGTPTAFQNLEWVTKNSENGKKMFERIQGVIRKRLESM